MQVTVTKLQAEMLKKIATSEFTRLNGAEPKNAEDTLTWASDVIETSQDKGVFTSLLNAGLAIHHGDGRDAVVKLSDSGFKVYKLL